MAASESESVPVYFDRNKDQPDTPGISKGSSNMSSLELTLLCVGSVRWWRSMMLSLSAPSSRSGESRECDESGGQEWIARLFVFRPGMLANL